MKTMGILGGMSWESTVVYYRLINEEVRARLGGLHSAPIFMYSVDFSGIRGFLKESKWDEAGRFLGDMGAKLAQAGAEFLLIATNTMHMAAPQVEAAAGLPLLHIADPTARAVLGLGMRRIGLLGTEYTMRRDFYKGRLRDKFGLEVVLPSEEDIGLVDRVIFDELCQGIIREDSRKEYLRVIADLEKRGAQGVILGCTEISLLVRQEHCVAPLFDTTVLHAKAAADWSINGSWGV